MTQRSDDFRYTVEIAGAEVSPLSQVEAFFGTLSVRVHNISAGGMAVIFTDEPKFKNGELLSISVAIRGRAFPLQIEIKNIRGFRVSCAFVESSPAFQAALRDYLRPKFLGQTMELNKLLSERKDVMALVPQAASYEAYIGQNQTGAFVWTDLNRSLLKMVVVSRDLVFEWTPKNGIRTGRSQKMNRSSDDPNAKAAGTNATDGGIEWHKNADVTLVHYFADVLMAWLKGESEFVEKLLSDLHLGDGEALSFPKI